MYDYEKLLKGCLTINDNNDYIKPERFTANQLNYLSHNEAYFIRAKSTAGVKMEFITNSDSISFEYYSDNCRKDIFYFDIYENDIFYSVIEGTKNIKSILNYEKKSKGRAKISIYFPHSCEIFIKNLDLGDIEYIDNRKSKNYLALGDSITQGFHADSPSLTFASSLSRYYNLNYLNQGIGGLIYNPLTLDTNINFKPDIITIAFGVNDANQIYKETISFEDFSINICDYLSIIKETYENSKVFLISPIWWSKENDCKIKSIIDKVRKHIEEQAMKYNFNFIDGNELVPHCEIFLNDGLHPNELGFSQYVLNLSRKIKL